MLCWSYDWRSFTGNESIQGHDSSSFRRNWFDSIHDSSGFLKYWFDSTCDKSGKPCQSNQLMIQIRVIPRFVHRYSKHLESFRCHHFFGGCPSRHHISYISHVTKLEICSSCQQLLKVTPLPQSNFMRSKLLPFFCVVRSWGYFICLMK